MDDHISANVLPILKSRAMNSLRNRLWTINYVSQSVKWYDNNSIPLLSLLQVLDFIPLAQSKFSIKVAAIM